MGFKFLELFLRRTFDSYGHWVGRRPAPFLVVPLLVNACLAVGLTYFNMDSDVGRLFTPHNSGSLRELQMLRQFSRTDGGGAATVKNNVGRRNEIKTQNLTAVVTKDDDNATAAAVAVSSLFEKTKSLQYLWYDVQLMHWEEKDILKHRPWNDIVELVRMIYENYTCTIRDQKSKENRQYIFIPDFCRPDVGCSRADENLIKIGKLLDLSRQNPNDANVRLTYPVMQIYGTSVNWGEFLQGVTVDSTTNKVTEAKLLIVPLQFQFDAGRQTLATVHECMRQLSAFYSNLGTYDKTINVYTAYEQMFIDEVIRTQEYILPYVCVTVVLVAIFCVLTTIEKDGSCKLVGSIFGLVTIGLALCSGFGLMFYLG
uniref:SSD domain-containing protein n=1 Tax=Romanomermis culicivorax TaxID=13658 RepID=A0A915K474_ROMCU